MSFLQLGLLIGAAALGVGSAFAWVKGLRGWALGLLMSAAFALRLLMASLDPFLHDWDERYHALVAKNLMANPLLPLLRAQAWLPYDYKAWCCNHVWLHKQPLFLWQIALSLKLFGVNEVALRLPSALLGALVLYPVYRLGLLIYRDATTGYLAALLTAFAYYNLEQTSGLIGMDHNDVSFMVYVTASLWAYHEYRAAAPPVCRRWAVAVGLLAGAAVLCKWLTGLVVYAAWGLDVLLTPAYRRQASEYVRLASSALVAVAVFLPWQLYTARRFPVESAYERTYNARHFTEALEGHGHPWYYHLARFPTHYGLIGLLVVVGLLLIFTPAERKRPLRPLLTAATLVYLFFSLAATKMYSYAYVVSPLLLVLAARPLTLLLRSLAAWKLALGLPLRAAVLALVVLADARPWGIVRVHFQEGDYGVHYGPLNRTKRTANAKLYRHLDQQVPPNYIVLNVLSGDEVEAMFYSDRDIYSWAPSPQDLQRARTRGFRLATFPAHHDQNPPEYVLQTPGLITIWGTPQ